MAGFLRYKADNLSVGTHTISIDIGGVTFTKTVRIKRVCSGDVYLKYIDKNGQYRFYNFNRFYEKKDSPKLIGSTNNTINSLLNDKSNKKNIGYENSSILNVIATDVESDEIDFLADIYTSPRVYMQIGNYDLDGDWVLVTVKSKDNIRKKRKGNFYTVELEITMPDQYLITMM